VESSLLVFGKAVHHIEDRAFTYIGIFAVIADLLTAEDDGVFVLHLIGEEAVISDAHLEADIERDRGSAFFADESVNLAHVITSGQLSTHLPQC